MAKVAFYLDRQTYNAVGLKFNYEFYQSKYEANISVFGTLGNDNAHLLRLLTLDFKQIISCPLNTN
jgi:hypothetical protein